MDFITAVKSCFQKYFQFSGRARRSEFWYWTLFTVVAGIVLSSFELALLGEGEYLTNVFSLATFFPGLAVSWRRLHDIDRSGWWIGGGYLVLAIFIFVVGFAVSLGGAVDTAVSNVFDDNVLIAVLAIIFGLGLFIWGIVVLVFFCTDTKKGDNRYGPDPKYQGAEIFD